MVRTSGLFVEESIVLLQLSIYAVVIAESNQKPRSECLYSTPNVDFSFNPITWAWTHC